MNMSWKILYQTLLITAIASLFLLQSLSQLDLILYRVEFGNESQNVTIRIEKSIDKDFELLKDNFPIKFADHIRNPCWFELPPPGPNLTTGPSNISRPILQCLPKVFILGQYKSGTTDLFRRLTRHPDVIRGEEKEFYWWTRTLFLNKQLISDNFYSYVKKFENVSNILQESCSSEVHYRAVPYACKHIITVDGTPCTLGDNRRTIEEFARKIKTGEISENAIFEYLRRRATGGSQEEFDFNFEEDDPFDCPLTVADIIKSILPDARFLVILRNPPDWLYSLYKHRRKSKPLSASPHDFDTRVTAEIKDWERCARAHSERSCTNRMDPKNFSTLNMFSGMFSIFLRDWFKVYSREQFFIIRTEDYVKNMDEHLQMIYEHTGLRNLTEIELKQIMEIKPVNKNYQVKIPGMLNNTRKKLKSFYSKFNEDLVLLLNDTRFLWSDIP